MARRTVTAPERVLSWSVVADQTHPSPRIHTRHHIPSVTLDKCRRPPLSAQPVWLMTSMRMRRLVAFSSTVSLP